MVGRTAILRSIDPIWSVNKEEARNRVIKLYKAWYRQIPYIVDDYNLPKSREQCRQKLHTEFLKYSDLRDIHQIDTLALNGQNEFIEMSCRKAKRSQILKYWQNDTIDSSPHKEFLSKFLVGRN